MIGLTNAGGGGLTGDIKIKLYASESDIPETGEDFELAIVRASIPRDGYRIAPDVVGMTGSPDIVHIRTDPIATSRISLGNSLCKTIIPIVNVSNYSLFPQDVLVAKLYIPYDFVSLGAVTLHEGWNRVGVHLHDYDIYGYEALGCTQPKTLDDDNKYIISISGSVAAGSTNMYTTSDKLRFASSYYDKSTGKPTSGVIFRKVHAIVQCPEVVQGSTAVRLGVTKIIKTGGNIALSATNFAKYLDSNYVYSDTELTTTSDTEVTLDITIDNKNLNISSESEYYLAIGAKNKGSASASIPIKVKYWWVE